MPFHWDEGMTSLTQSSGSLPTVRVGSSMLMHSLTMMVPVLGGRLRQLLSIPSCRWPCVFGSAGPVSACLDDDGAWPRADCISWRACPLRRDFGLESLCAGPVSARSRWLDHDLVDGGARLMVPLRLLACAALACKLTWCKVSSVCLWLSLSYLILMSPVCCGGLRRCGTPRGAPTPAANGAAAAT